MSVLEGGVLMEYHGIVTQLSATSEVAQIGFLVDIPEGDRVQIFGGRLSMSNQGTGKQGRIELKDSNGGIMYLTFAILDNQSIRILPANEGDNVSGVVEQTGFPDPLIMGFGEQLKAFTDTAIDADTTLTFKFKYLSRFGNITVTPVGSGISVSSEVHKAI